MPVIHFMITDTVVIFDRANQTLRLLINAHTGETMINVFVPTTPNPTSGFFLMVPKKDVQELDISIDEGLKMIISAGVVVPTDKNNGTNKS